MAISVQKQFTVHIPSGQQASNQNVTIPAGKTMTITHVSGRLTVPAPAVAQVNVQNNAFQIDVPGGTNTGYHYFPTSTSLTVNSCLDRALTLTRAAISL